MDFGLEQYTRMAELLRTMKGKVIVSVNDIPEMRQAFAGLAITYTVGTARKSTGELVIRNF